MSPHNEFNNGCPRTEIPEDLPIPRNLTYVVIPGRNASDPWMVNCCDPYPVQVVKTCWEWCEIDPAVARNFSDFDIMSDFGYCLDINDRDTNLSASLMLHRAAAPRGRSASLLVSVLVALAASMAVSFIA